MLDVVVSRARRVCEISVAFCVANMISSPCSRRNQTCLFLTAVCLLDQQKAGSRVQMHVGTLARTTRLGPRVGIGGQPRCPTENFVRLASHEGDQPGSFLKQRVALPSWSAALQQRVVAMRILNSSRLSLGGGGKSKLFETASCFQEQVTAVAAC